MKEHPASDARTGILDARVGIIRAGLLLYAAVNGILYASLLPLWEGFDEPFHYGYVQELSHYRRLPTLGKTPLPSDTCQSLALAPASHVVKKNLASITTFSEYFKLSRDRRDAVRLALRRLPASAAYGACGPNYEAHQAPLAYAILAVADYAASGLPLPSRVWLLRLICAFVGAGGTACLLLLFARRLRLADNAANAVAFVVLSSQMLYATTAHIANDWLAVPLMLLLFDRAAAFWETPNARAAVLLAAVLAGGLLTKALFLAMIPAAIGLVVAAAAKHRLRWQFAGLFFAITAAASPWYLRNFLLYRNVSGMQETLGGTNFSVLARSFAAVPWLHSLWTLALGSLWTGNNSFATFSRTTLVILLAGYLLAAVCYAIDAARHTPPLRERIVLCGCAVYGVALLYSTTVSAWSTGGAAFSTSAWYTQPLFPIVAAILFRGLSRFRPARFAHAIAVGLVCLAAYVLCATYWAKLIPMYGGFEGRATASQLVGWYRASGPRFDVLSSLAIAGNADLIAGLAVLSTGMAVALGSSCALGLVRAPRAAPRSP